jgi:hypothetical protein
MTLRTDLPGRGIAIGFYQLERHAEPIIFRCP